MGFKTNKMKILILLLFPIVMFGQNKGKIVRNQSVKVEATWDSTENGYMCKVYNMNKCDSYIELDFGSGVFQIPIPLRQFSYENVLLIKDAMLKIRNATLCPNGTTEWLTLDSGRLIDGVSTTNISVGKITKKVNCETIKAIPLPIKRDTTIATKL